MNSLNVDRAKVCNKQSGSALHSECRNFRSFASGEITATASHGPYSMRIWADRKWIDNMHVFFYLQARIWSFPLSASLCSRSDSASRTRTNAGSCCSKDFKSSGQARIIDRATPAKHCITNHLRFTGTSLYSRRRCIYLHQCHLRCLCNMNYFGSFII